MNGLIIDNFAGGGGASTGIERALGRAVDIAINHDATALAMHKANHPETRHYRENVFAIDPVEICGGRPVDLAWFSPDCTYHSRARGGQPIKNNKKHIRGLAWVATRWARVKQPRVIILENVKEFEDWGPLGPDGRPDPKRKGHIFNFWTEKLRRYGYRAEWRTLRACDYGAPTIRERLFLVARCDGLPIIWPEQTHGPEGSGLLPYRPAAEIIDWSLPCPSIFERKKPLADATCRRIAKGIVRYVIEAKEPFLVSVAHGDSGGRREYPLSDPLGTVTGGGIAHALVSPTFVLTNTSGHPGAKISEPLRTVTTGGHHALVTAFLAKHYGGVVGHELERPIGTVTAVDHHSLVASHLIKMKGTCKDGLPVTEPLHTIQAGGLHYGEVRTFLLKYYGTDQNPSLFAPLHTCTAKHRFGLVTVNVGGEPYVIADIGMRMLQPRELFRAQGFPDDYDIDCIINGRGMTKTNQVRMCGNSVSPPVAEALVRANFAAAGELEATG